MKATLYAAHSRQDIVGERSSLGDIEGATGSGTGGGMVLVFHDTDGIPTLRLGLAPREMRRVFGLLMDHAFGAVDG